MAVIEKQEESGLTGLKHAPLPCGNKKAPHVTVQGFSLTRKPAELLQLGFLVVNVLASDRIKFLDQHLLGHVALVLGGRVEMTRAGGRLEFDLFADTFGHVVLLVW
jgi:hypothetical protein